MNIRLPLRCGTKWLLILRWIFSQLDQICLAVIQSILFNFTIFELSDQFLLYCEELTRYTAPISLIEIFNRLVRVWAGRLLFLEIHGEAFSSENVIGLLEC